MNFQKYTLISNIDDNDIIELNIDLDTIDDDEPYIIMTQETLDIDGETGMLQPHSMKFLDAYDEDDQFKQWIWDIHDKPNGYKVDRGVYTIKVGGWNE